MNDEIRDLVGRGEYLRAHDAAAERLRIAPDDPESRYLLVLALARAGATDRAVEQFRSLDLEGFDDPSTELADDVASLGARLDKDRALAATGGERRRSAEAAARRYEDVHRRTDGSYPAVNAATMWLMAGDAPRSAELARRALERSDRDPDPYWRAATRAEAALILGRTDLAAESLVEADAANRTDLAARASTRRQLELVVALTGADPAVLEPIANPPVIHYCGHRMSAPGRPGRFRADEEDAATVAVVRALDDLAPVAGFGSLASGADIVVAEALLERGAELHVRLPFERDEFVRWSVADAGPAWVGRFERCLAGADSVVVATPGDPLDDPVLFDYCARLAMGDALVRARFLGTRAHQIAVWDGRPTYAVAGTAVDVARWARTGQHATVVPVEGAGAAVPTGDDPGGIREIRAMVFADVAGFSRLDDAEIGRYDRTVLGELGAVIDGFGDAVLLRETWGDGIYLVLADVRVGAKCALALQAAFSGIDLHGLGLGAVRGLRVGAHVGPVLQGWDPIAGRVRFSGTHVTRAARIEPRTPEGAVYVTREFAAAATLEAPGEVTCQYVGQVPMAKDYGEHPMFLLTAA